MCCSVTARDQTIINCMINLQWNNINHKGQYESCTLLTPEGSFEFVHFFQGAIFNHDKQDMLFESVKIQGSICIAYFKTPLLKRQQFLIL